ncbi:MAG: hypothetical protein HC890_04730 [Chloroflexaceae bacterium]|nr:hypothetical protein [Chloroflexaceae bacterium]
MVAEETERTEATENLNSRQVLDVIEERLRETASFQDAELWLRLRGEWLQQSAQRQELEQNRRQNRHNRFLQVRSPFSQMGFAWGLGVVGLILLFRQETGGGLTLLAVAISLKTQLITAIFPAQPPANHPGQKPSFSLGLLLTLSAAIAFKGASQLNPETPLSAVLIFIGVAAALNALTLVQNSGDAQNP